MRIFSRFLLVALFALGLSVPAVAADPAPAAPAAAPAPAAAKSLNIAVVDIQALLKSSKAAQSIETQLATIRKNFQAEVDKEEKTLKDSEKSILEQKGKLSEADFKTKVTDFQKQVAAGQKKVQDRKATLDKAVAAAIGQLRNEILKVVAEIGEKKNLDMVLARTDVVIVSKTLDITQDVLTRIDTELPSVKVDVK